MSRMWMPKATTRECWVHYSFLNATKDQVVSSRITELAKLQFPDIYNVIAEFYLFNIRVEFVLLVCWIGTAWLMACAWAKAVGS